MTATVALLDIEDASAFVHATINRAKLVLSPDEREELHAEGMAKLVELARNYKPHIEGHETEGRFSGYAAMYLPRKLGDAWHRLNENHQLVTDPETGKRKWHYKERAVSLEAMVADDPDRGGLLAVRGEGVDLAGRMHRALFEKWTHKIEVIVRVGELLIDGETPAYIAKALNVGVAEVHEAMGEIASVAPRIGALKVVDAEDDAA